VVAVPYADEKRDAGRFEEWVRAGRAGTMDYLKRTGQNAGETRIRSRAAKNGPLCGRGWGFRFRGLSRPLCGFAGYDSAQPRSIDPAKQEEGWIARYAWSGRRDAGGVRRPSDYHKVLLKRIKALEARIRAARLRDGFGEFEARGYVDTGPLVERALATAAGLAGRERIPA